MPKRIGFVPRQPVGLISLSLIMIAALWASLFFDIRRLEENALRQARNDGSNLIIAFKESVNKTIRAIDLMMVASISENNRASTGDYFIPEWVKNSLLLKELGAQLSIVGQDGKIAASTIAGSSGVNLSDRPHIRHHYEPSAPQPHISVPVVGRATGKWAIQITRRIVRNDGGIGGVMVVSLDPFHFSRLLESLNLGKDSVFSLTGFDGIVRSRRALTDSDIGQDASGGALFKQVMKTGAGSYSTRSVVDGLERIFAYSALGDYPLYVAIGLARNDVLAAVNDQKQIYLSTGGGLTIAIGALGWFLVREAKKRRKRELATIVEEKTHEQKTFLDAALNNMRDGLVMYDKNNRVVVLNRRYLEMYNLSSEVAKPGCTLRELLNSAAKAGTFYYDGDVDTYIKERVSQGGAPDRVLEIPDGRSFRIVRRTMEDGGWVVTHEDITLRKLHEKQLLQLNSELEERVRVRSAELVKAQEQAHATQAHAHKMEAIGKLTGGMAHDFNNYLGVIIGNLDLAGKLPADDPMVKDLIEEAMSGALRSSDLTKSLLAFSRRQPLAAQRTNIADVLTADVTLLKRALRTNIALTTELAPDLWPAHIDRAQLDSCIINLIKNAGDAIPDSRDGSVIVAARNVRFEDQCTVGNTEVTLGDYVLIEISDNGTGMSQETVSQVFEPFFTTKPVGHGTGLGLSVVYGFIKQSGGYIDVYSELGHGTKISIYLPRDCASELEKATGNAELAARVNGKETILVVEDNDMMRRAAAKQLASCGYQVIEAENGYAGLLILEQREQLIDLLFTDVIMPGGIDGYKLAKLASEIRPGIGILLTSGFPGDPSRQKDAGTESLTLLSKPYRFNDLARAIRTALDGREPSVSPPTQPYPIAHDAVVPREIEVIST